MLHWIAYGSRSVVAADRRCGERASERSGVDAWVPGDEADRGSERSLLLLDQIFIGHRERVQLRDRRPFPVEIDEVGRLPLGEGGEALFALLNRATRYREIVVGLQAGVGDRYWIRYLPLSLVESRKPKSWLFCMK